MAELKRNFLGSKMNISLDDRILPPGEYRLAWNVNVSLSENSDVGALENVRGNQEVFLPPELPSKGPSYEDIGVAKDSLNDRVYWFFVGPQTEGIYEFDLSIDDREFFDDERTERNPNFGEQRNVVNRIVEFSKNRKILNLQTSHLITGADIIDDLLYWTDGFNPPRKINIERFRGSGNLEDTNKRYSEDFNPVVSSIDPSYDGNGNELLGLTNANLTRAGLTFDTPFVGDYLSVAKRPPLQAPLTQCPAVLDETDTNGPGQDAQGFITHSVTIPAGATQIDLPQPFRIPNINIRLTVGGTRVAIGEGEDWLINEGFNSQILFNGLTPLATDTDVIVEYIPVNDSEQTFEPSNFLAEKFISFAYRYRYRDGEISAISPFSEVAFLPKPLVDGNGTVVGIDPDTSEFISMRNRFEQIEVKYNPGSDEVTEVEIVASVAGDSNLYSVVIINKEENDIGDSTPYSDNLQAYTYKDNKVYRVLPSDQLTRIYDNVPLRAKAQEIIGNRLVYGNYVENYDLRTGGPEGHPNSERLVPNFTLDYDVTTRPEQNEDLLPARSVKTDRDYEVGIVYLDREGRQTPAITSELNSTFIPFVEPDKGGLLTDKQIKLTVDIRSEAPWWATHYRFFVKQSSLDYYNMFPQAVIRGTGDAERNLYLRIDATEINKYQAGQTILLKNNDGNLLTERLEFRIDAVGQNIEDRADTPVTLEEITTLTADVAGFNATDYPTSLYVRLKPIKGTTVARLTDLFSNTAATENVYFEGVPSLDSNLNIYFEYGKTFRVFNGVHTDSTSNTIPSANERKQIVGNEFKVELEWSNCYTFWNGIEETRILGSFNEVALPQGIKATTVQEEYRQVEHEAGLIHSGIFNDRTGLNRLNEFNPSLPITWDIDVADGSIQHLHGRNTNLIVFQEDKVKRMPINKNLIQTAGGGNQLTTSSSFFNTEQAFAGNYGISLNPESFASYGETLYFADKNRGVLCSLTPGNGQIVEISKQGVEEFVRDAIRDADVLLGFYDDVQDQYNISFKNRAIQPQDANGNFVTTVLGNLDNSTPRAACNRNHDVQTYETYHGIAFDTSSFSIGDTYYMDADRTIKFNGWNAWYIVRTNNPTFNPNDPESSVNRRYEYLQTIQINEDGLVTSIVTDCDTQQPITRISGFGMSSIAYGSEFEACALGLVDTILYHDGAEDEPGVRDLIYETIYDEIQSTRDGWYLMTEGRDKFVVRLGNGEVLNKIDCRIISAGRTRIIGSAVVRFRPVGSQTNAQNFITARNVLLCQRTPTIPYYFESEGAVPEVGDILYDANFRTTTQQVVDTSSTGANARESYVLFANGIFVRINEAPQVNGVGPLLSEVLEVGLCSEYVCWSSPNELFTQDANNNRIYTFDGIADENGVLRGRGNIEIYYTVQGTRHYPEQGEYVYQTMIEDGLVVPLELSPTDTFTLPLPSDTTFINETVADVDFVITRMCYRGIGSSNAIPIYRTDVITGDADDRFFNACELTVDATDMSRILYYNPDEVPRRFYNSNLLDTVDNNVFTTAGQYGVTDDPDLGIEEIIQIGTDGREISSGRVQCEVPYVAQLAYDMDNLQESCTAAVNVNSFNTYYTNRRYVNTADLRYDDNGTLRNLSRWSTDESAAAVLPNGTAAPAQPITIIHQSDGANTPAIDGFYTGYTDISQTSTSPVGNQNNRVVRQVIGGILQNDSEERCEIIPDPTNLTVNQNPVIPFGTDPAVVSVTARSTTAGATFRWQAITGAGSVTGLTGATQSLTAGTYNVTANSATTLPTTLRVTVTQGREVVDVPDNDPDVIVRGGFSFRYVYDLGGALTEGDVSISGPTRRAAGNEGVNFPIPQFGVPAFRDGADRWVVSQPLARTVTYNGGPVPATLSFPAVGVTNRFVITITGAATRRPDEIAGCTNSVALNFNAAADYDDGSCVLPLSSITARYDSSDAIRACMASNVTVYSTTSSLGAGLVLNDGRDPRDAGLAARGFYSNGSRTYMYGGAPGDVTIDAGPCASATWAPNAPGDTGTRSNERGTLTVFGGTSILSLNGGTNFLGNTSGGRAHDTSLTVTIEGVGTMSFAWTIGGGTAYRNLTFGQQPVIDRAFSAGVPDRFGDFNRYNGNPFANVETARQSLTLRVPAGTYNWTAVADGTIPLRWAVNASQPS